MAVPGSEQEDSGLRITLKDVFTAQQSIESKLTETFANLQVTLTKIQSHLDNVEQRNQAADELHREHGRRIGEIERVLDVTGVRNLRSERQVIVDDFEARIRGLERKSLSEDAVAQAKTSAAKSASNARVAFWGMIAALATLAGVIVSFTVFLLTRH